jgi:ferredoxin-like protein FixX
MIEIEKYLCKDANEALTKEREWFERLNSRLNTKIPNRMSEFEFDANLYARQYNMDNKDIIRARSNQHHKDNRNEKLLKQKIYRENNKEEIATKRKETFTCECGKVRTWSHKLAHFRTVFHLKYMEHISALAQLESVCPTDSV